jgi:hypothetical protein
MAVRPVTDYWILARCKHRYFGGYPAGFLERARFLLGCTPEDTIAHIPGGMAHKYNGAGGMPLSGYGPRDYRIDINPETEPDICMDVRDLKKISIMKRSFPEEYLFFEINKLEEHSGEIRTEYFKKPRPQAIIIDRPYTEEYAKRYNPNGDEIFPNLNQLTKDCLRLVKPGGRVGILDYQTPQTRHVAGKCLARVAVDLGDGLNIRIFSVWKKVEENGN